MLKQVNSNFFPCSACFRFRAVVTRQCKRSASHLRIQVLRAATLAAGTGTSASELCTARWPSSSSGRGAWPALAEAPENSKLSTRGPLALVLSSCARFETVVQGCWTLAHRKRELFHRAACQYVHTDSYVFKLHTRIQISMCFQDGLERPQVLKAGPEASTACLEHQSIPACGRRAGPGF